MRQAIYKVPNGKLLKIFLEEKDGKVSGIKITGDFFMHPEEKITSLEQSLIGVNLDQASLQQSVQAFLTQEKIELFGADDESIATTIMMATEKSS